jgi:hypothetical protein
MPSHRNRSAAPGKRRADRGKRPKVAPGAKSAARKPHDAQPRKSPLTLPPPLRTPFFAMPLRDAGYGDTARAVDAAFRAFARMPRSKSRVLH